MPIPWNRWVDPPTQEPMPPVCASCGELIPDDRDDLCPTCELMNAIDPSPACDGVTSLIEDLERLECQRKLSGEEMREELGRILEKRRL